MKLVATKKNVLILDKMFINICLIIGTLQSHHHTSILYLFSFALYSHLIVQNFPHSNKTLSVYFTDLILLPSSSLFLPILSRTDPLSHPLFSPQAVKNKPRTSSLTVFLISVLLEIVGFCQCFIWNCFLKHTFIPELWFSTYLAKAWTCRNAVVKMLK